MRLAAGQDAGGVGEAAAAGDLHFVQLRPVLLRVEDQPPGDRVAGRFRDGGHVPHHAARRAPAVVMIMCPGMNYIAVICLGRCRMPRCCGAGHADRVRAQDAEEAGAGREDAVPGPAAGAGRAGCRPRPGECADRRRPAGSAWPRCASGGAGSRSTGWRGLKDLPRSGRPRRITEADRAAVVALACQLPAESRGAAVPVDRPGAEARAGGAAPWSAGRCRCRRCCGSWRRTRSSRGGTSPGSSPATRTSRRRRT